MGEVILQGEGGDDDVGGGLSTRDVDGDGLDDLFIGGGATMTGETTPAGARATGHPLDAPRRLRAGSDR